LPDSYYDILGVPKDAPDKEVRAAYRRFARKFHPDVNPGDRSAEEKFKRITEAYEVLSDPKLRKDYDEYGANWKHAEDLRRAGAPAGRPGADFGPGAGSHASGFDPRTGTRYEFFSTGSPGGPNVSDIFQMFGMDGGPFGTADGRARQQAQELEVEITLDEAYKGATRLITLDRGRRGATRLEVKVPAGIAEGGRVRVRPEGGPELQLLVRVKPDPRFQRDGADLATEAPAPLSALMLGGEVTVPTVTGQVSLKVPPGTQNGKRFRISGKGMPKLGTPSVYGDLYVTVKAVLPENLTEDERRLFKRLSDIQEAKKRGAFV